MTGKYLLGRKKTGGRKKGVRNVISRRNLEAVQDVLYQWAQDLKRRGNVGEAVKLFAAIAGNGSRKHRQRWKVPKHVKIHSE